MNYRAKKGFYLRDSIPVIEKACGRSSKATFTSDDFEKMLDDLESWLYGTSGKIFFLERITDAIELDDSRVIIGQWGKRPIRNLQESLDLSVKSGFIPIDAGFSKIYDKSTLFLIMSPNSVSSEPKYKTAYKVLTTEFNFEKKVNRLAKEGFKILFYDTLGAFGFVLMSKEESVPNLVSYHWVDMTRNNYQDRIQNLTKQGAVYKTIGTTVSTRYPCDDFEGILVFEKPLDDNNKRLEYKILKMSKDFKEFRNNLSFELLSTSEETMTELNLLLNEGFIIRDLFFADGVNVLFERDMKQTVEKTVNE